MIEILLIEDDTRIADSIQKYRNNSGNPISITCSSKNLVNSMFTRPFHWVNPG